MAAVIAKATGYDKSRVKETYRLGSEWAMAEASTWQTFATVETDKDGSVTVSIRRGAQSFYATFAPESEDLTGSYRVANGASVKQAI